jgi:predicted DNA-binding transcriptional regulator AlpA
MMNVHVTSLRFIRLPAVEVRTGLKRQQLFSLGRDGAFPKPITVAGEIAWNESQVEDFIEGRIRAIHGGQP